MKHLALSLLLILGPLSARAESLLFLEKADTLASRTALEMGDVLEFPSGFRLENFNAEKGYAATVFTGKGVRGQSYACALSLRAISEVRFASSLQWNVTSLSRDGEVTFVSLKNEQFDERPLELRCSNNAPVGEILAGKGVKLRELNAYESLDDRIPASN